MRFLRRILRVRVVRLRFHGRSRDPMGDPAIPRHGRLGRGAGARPPSRPAQGDRMARRLPPLSPPTTSCLAQGRGPIKHATLGSGTVTAPKGKGRAPVALHPLRHTEAPLVRRSRWKRFLGVSSSGQVALVCPWTAACPVSRLRCELRSARRFRIAKSPFGDGEIAVRGRCRLKCRPPAKNAEMGCYGRGAFRFLAKLCRPWCVVSHMLLCSER